MKVAEKDLIGAIEGFPIEVVQKTDLLSLVLGTLGKIEIADIIGQKVSWLQDLNG